MNPLKSVLRFALSGYEAKQKHEADVEMALLQEFHNKHAGLEAEAHEAYMAGDSSAEEELGAEAEEFSQSHKALGEKLAFEHGDPNLAGHSQEFQNLVFRGHEREEEEENQSDIKGILSDIVDKIDIDVDANRMSF